MHVETETSRNKAKKLPKKAQREKINAGGGKPKQQTSRNKEKIIKIKKVRDFFYIQICHAYFPSYK